MENGSRKTEVQRLKYALADCADFADILCNFRIISESFFCILNFQNFVFQLIATQSSAKSAKSVRVFFCILNFQIFVFQLIATQSSAKSAKSVRVFLYFRFSKFCFSANCNSIIC